MKNTFVTYNKVVRKLTEIKPSTAHSLVELSETQWKRLESRSILLTGLISHSTHNNKVEYTDYAAGAKLSFKRSFGKSSGVNKQWRNPMLANIQGGCMLMVVKKQEILDHNPHVIVVDGSSQELLCDNTNDISNYKPSGILVLLMVKLKSTLVKSQYSWGQKDAVEIKKWKNNIISKHSTHFGSTGNYYSFGNRANYGMIDQSSLTQFVHKKFKSLTKMKTARNKAEMFENLLGDDLKLGVESLVSVLPTIKEYICPTLNIAYNLQADVGDCNLQTTAVSNVGLWQSSICVDCQTSSFHTENDCSYTIITTPKQEKKCAPIFLFELQKGLTIGLQMDPGLSFMFSGKYLYHRQMVLDNNDINEQAYINLASYGNDKLFNHFRSTVKRVISK